MKRRLFKAIILGLVIGLVGPLLSPFRFALNLEKKTGLALLFELRGCNSHPARWSSSASKKNLRIISTCPMTPINGRAPCTAV
jgi:hypothetical protein